MESEMRGLVCGIGDRCEQPQEMGGLVWGGRVTAAEWRAAADERRAARAAAPERAWAI